MRGAQSRQWTPDDVASSYALWWREAGLVDATSAQAHGWRESPVALAAPAPRPAQPSAPALPPASAAPPRPTQTRPVPTGLAAFHAWLAEDPAQPEAAWTGPSWLPPALPGERLLILADMPDDGLEAPSLPFAPARARFLAAMLTSLGLTLDDVAIAPLAMRRPPGGVLDDTVFASLTARMRQYLALAAPRAALILGDRTSRALTATQGAPAQGSLTEINLSTGKLVTATLASPDHLMRRPTAKAASWQTLRLLTGVIAA